MSRPTNGASNGEGARRDAGEDEQTLADADQTASDLDQSAADADQTAADRDWANSERDRSLSGADQRASDRDQATADREACDGGGAVGERTVLEIRREEEGENGASGGPLDCRAEGAL